jgi:uncharacterized lipoprotein YddW (UPF0748 family)/putative cell wall-binding protein
MRSIAVAVAAVTTAALTLATVRGADAPPSPAPAALAESRDGDGRGDAAAATAEEPVRTATAVAGGPACHTRASSRSPVDRVAGSNRWATAVCASQVAYPSGVDTVVLARGDAAGGYADALAGAVLARHVDGPVLLTAPDVLPAETAAELDRLAPRRVVVLGGTKAVAPTVERAVARRGPAVERLAGADRAATAARIAATVGTRETAFVVNGYQPADALVAATAAAREGALLLLANPDGVPASTTEALRGVRRVSVVGDFRALDESAEATLRRLVGGANLERLGGPDPAEVAATVARAHPASGTVHLVSDAPASLVDALSASWTAARPGGGPVLFAGRDAPGRGTDRYLRLGGLDRNTAVRLVGGGKVLSDRLVAALEQRYDEARAGGPRAEVRGVWVHLFDASLKSRSGIDRMLDAAVAANLNTVVVQVARRHDAFYASDVIPRTTDPKMPPGLDLLARLVPAAHARGLDVHAWYSLMPTYHDSFRTGGERLPADHVHSLHGPKGTQGSWMAAANTAGYDFLDPGIPGVHDHVAAMLREVVERYDVDGIHLDYLRYAAGGSTLNPIAMERFRRVGGGMTLDDFRRRQTEDLARRVYLEVADADPSVVVSMAAIAQGAGPTGTDLRASFRRTRAYAEKFQDWPTWLDRGIVDLVFPMAYFQEATRADWFDQWTRFTGGLRTGVNAMGLAAYQNPVSGSLAQLDDARARTRGVVLYSYQQDSAGGQGPLLAALPTGRFADPAPVPAVPAKDRPTRGHVLAHARDGQTVTATPVAGGEPRTLRTDATGRAGFVGLPPGTWSVAVPGRPPVVVQVAAGRVAHADLE